MHQFHQMFEDNSEPFGAVLGGGRDVRRRRARRPHRGVAAREGRGSGARGEPARAVRRHDVLLPRPVQPVPHRRRRAVAEPRAARDRAVGRAARRKRSTSSTGSTGWRRASSRSRGVALFLFADRLFKAGYLDGDRTSRRSIAIIAVGMCVGFLPFNWQPREDHHGRRGRAVPRPHARRADDHDRRADRLRVLRQHVLLLRAPRDPGDHPRRPGRRHRCSRSCGGSSSASTGTRPTPATCTTGSMRLGHGPRRTVVMLWAWTALLSARRAVADLHEAGQRARAVRRRRASRWCSSSCSTPVCASAAAEQDAAPRHPHRRRRPARTPSVDLEQRRRAGLRPPADGSAGHRRRRQTPRSGLTRQES